MASERTSSDVLTAADRDAIAGLQYFARGVVEGLHSGRHRSSHKGASIQFKEHRQYVRGDEIRSIDWKLFGKTDRLYIRQYEDETNLRSLILLDQSGSMAYRGQRSDLSKHQFAVRLAACLATLLISQQDSVGIATFDNQLRAVLPARSTPRHLTHLLQVLVGSQPGHETGLADVLASATTQLRRRGVLVLISDCFDSVERLMPALTFFRHSGSEVVVLQVWDRDELEFPFRSRAEFRSLEQATRRHLVNPLTLRAAYLRRVAEFQSALSVACGKARIDLIQCVSDQPYAQILSNYLASRAGRAVATSRTKASELKP